VTDLDWLPADIAPDDADFANRYAETLATLWADNAREPEPDLEMLQFAWNEMEKWLTISHLPVVGHH
jgi:hypothetical protein